MLFLRFTNAFTDVSIVFLILSVFRICLCIRFYRLMFRARSMFRSWCLPSCCNAVFVCVFEYTEQSTDQKLCSYENYLYIILHVQFFAVIYSSRMP